MADNGDIRVPVVRDGYVFSGGGPRDDHDLEYPIGSVSDMPRGYLWPSIVWVWTPKMDTETRPFLGLSEMR